LLALMLVAAACTSNSEIAEPDGVDAKPTQVDVPGPLAVDGTPALLQTSGPLTLTLSAGQGLAPEAETLTVVDGQSLTDSQVQAIVDRLPTWAPDSEDQEDFDRPAETLPPPRTGETIESTFPVSLEAPGPEAVPSGPLEVLRFQPDGDVDVAPSISVTFNQPMVPVTTLSQLDAQDVPVTITPDLVGTWQWIGTRTLRFEYESDLFDRLPMATEYTVEIPARTTSQSGAELTETVTWQFQTPTVQIIDFYPEREGLALNPIFVVRFDQRVDPAEVLETVTMRADGEVRAIRLATEDEIADDEELARRVSAALEGRFIAFRSEEPFDPDTRIAITFGPNVPSSEGPRTSSSTQRFSASTFAPLQVENQNCQGSESCYPQSPLNMWFNNELDLDAFYPALIEIEPELAGAVISAQGSSILIRGATRGATTYQVTLPAGLRDVWGQTLGEDVTLSFKVGPAQPQLIGFQRELLTTDPYSESPSVSVTSVNHERLDVEIYRVEPSDWPKYMTALERQYDESRSFNFSVWDRVVDRAVDVGGEDDQFTETTIDLSDALNGDTGQLVVVVSPERQFRQDDPLYWSNRPTMVWVQVTNIGLDVFTDRDEIVVWTTDLATGTPLAGVEVSLVGVGTSLTTGAGGLATAELSAARTEVVVATDGTDVAMLASPYDSFGREQTDDVVLFHVFDDRAIYRPGETVNVKGWARRLNISTDAQIALIGDSANLTYRAYDSVGNEIATGTTTVSRLGGFDFAFDIPAQANLGFAYIDLSLDGVSGIGGPRSTSQPFQIQEFRRPEFEVTARNESPGPYLRTDPATVAVDAAYFSGGPLPNAEVNWVVTTRNAIYSPPNWDEFTFGTWVPWWIGGPFYDDYSYGREFGYADAYFEDSYYIGDGFSGVPGFDPGEVKEFSGFTDANGSNFLQIDFGGDETDQPVTVSAQATVFDVNRQAWASATDLLIHPADLYVGLRGERTFVRQGDPLEISTIVTDIAGNIVADKAVTVVAGRLEWRIENGIWDELVVATQTCQVRSETGPVSCTFETDEGGTYSITATVTDDAGRSNRSELTRWVSGGNARPTRNIEQEQVTLISDKAEYAPGDTAQILVEAPFAGGKGIVTVARNGIVSTSPVEFDGSTAVLSIPISESDIPNLHVQFDVVGASERLADDGTVLPGAPDRPAFAVGNLVLAVPPTSRTLSVEIEPAAATIEPGSRTSVAVTVTDAAGRPVQDAELAVVVVDEAVLALSNYELLDPVSTFYRQIPAELRSRYGRSSLVLDNPQDFEKAGIENAEFSGAARAGGDDVGAEGPFAADGGEAAAGYAGSQGQASTPTIDVRTNFDALAVFAPEVTTDADGLATIRVPLPDNLTRYRVMVVAVDGDDQFGSAESNITARLPLMVRPSAPRFLNFGDEFELPVVVQNQTDQPMDVDVVLQTANLVMADRSGTTVTVPANDRIEVRFEVAADRSGTARFRVAAVSGGASDAAAVSLPVYTPATAEAFATYGVLDDDGSISQPILAPTEVWPQFGGLEINTSSTALQALTDAVIYINDYSYRSADGLASRILAIAALRDVLDAFDAEGLASPALLDATVQADLDDLRSLQNPDGGFPIWRRFDISWPYHSVQVAHALVEAKNNGYAVPADTLSRALDYVRNIENFYPPTYGERTRNTISAYALNVRYLAGDTDSGKAADLYRSASASDMLSLEAVAWLWPVVDDASIEREIERLFNNRATETAGAATFTTSYGEDDYLVLNSSRRADGVILDALIAEAPDSDLIPKVVAGLLGNQTRGRWANMQENMFILLALNNYFDTFESEDPDFVARVWLGDIYAAETTFEGRSTDRNETLVPMADLIAQGDSDLVVDKDGADGRLYYRLGLRYAPSDLDLDPLDRGFVVSRTYEGVDDPDDVRLGDDGVWRIKAGAQVLVRLMMVADSRRTHVALIDPLPAGLESLNPALAVTPDIDLDPTVDRSSYYYWRWFNYQNLRDDRAEAFATIVYAGTYEYTYVTRATTPGEFVTPPTRAEEIYAPETFGRSGTDIVVVVVE